jgi:hypothetical protein
LATSSRQKRIGEYRGMPVSLSVRDEAGATIGLCSVERKPGLLAESIGDAQRLAL